MKIKINEKQVTLNDLRRLGRQGGATARLDNGSEMVLRENFGTIKAKGYIAGELQLVEVIADYPKVYSQIRTIMRNGILVARREKVNRETVLQLTGRGYTRKK